MSDQNKQAVLIEVLLATGLAAFGFATVAEPWEMIITTATGVGGNWVASLAERAFKHLKTGFLTERGILQNDIAWLLKHSFQQTIKRLEIDWKKSSYFRYLKTNNVEKAEETLSLFQVLEEDTNALFEQPFRLRDALQREELSGLLNQDQEKVQKYLMELIKDYWYGHDEELIIFLEKRLPYEWINIIYHELRGSGKKQNRARIAFEQLCWLSIISAMREIKTSVDETKEITSWLRDSYRKLFGNGKEAGKAKLFDSLVLKLLEQASLETLPKKKIYVSSVCEPLIPYRKKAIDFLTQADYEVISIDDELPFEQQLERISDCDLFVGLYAHKNSCLPDTPDGRERPIVIDELEKSLFWFRRSLIYVASDEIDTLTLKPPKEPKFGLRPVYQNIPDPNPPSDFVFGWQIILKTIIARVKGLSTPYQNYLVKLDDDLQKRRDISLKRRAQRKKFIEENNIYDENKKKEQEKYHQDLEQFHLLISEQREFLETIENHFQITRIKSQDNLAELLKNDIDKLARGEIIGFSTQELLKRWNLWIINHLENIREFLPYNPPLNPPLASSLDNFITYQWLEKLLPFFEDSKLAAEEINNLEVTVINPLRDTLENIHEIGKEIVDIGNDNYQVVTRRLSNWRGRVSTHLEKAINDLNLLEKQDNLTSDDINVIRSYIEDLADKLKNLHSFLKNKNFGNCLLVMGGAGSGKTHLVSYLLQNHNRQISSSSIYCLYVSRDLIADYDNLPASIDDLLLDSARFLYSGKLNGPEWRSFKELVSFVKTQNESNSKLLVIFDELDMWIKKNLIDLDELEEFIQNHTSHVGVKWVFTLSEANYDFVVPNRKHEQFWSKNSFTESKIEPTCGWINLDRLNETSKQWKKIIEHQLKNSRVESIDNITSKLEISARQLLYNPFIALVFGQLLRDGDIPIQELINLNYIDFVRSFWEKRLAQLSQEDTSDTKEYNVWLARYWRVIYLLAGFVLEAKQLTIKEKVIVEQLIERNQSEIPDFKQSINQIIQYLNEFGVLHKEKDPQKIAKYGIQYSLDFLPLWAWQAGENVLAKVSDRYLNNKNVQVWINLYFDEIWNKEFLEGLLEFVILLADEKSDELENLATEIIDHILHALPIFQSQVWIAASKISPEYQYQIAHWLDQQEIRNVIREDELHRYLYFLNHAEYSSESNKGITFLLRMKLMQPYYKQFTLGQYFRDSIERQIAAERNTSEIARGFAYFYGIEEELDNTTCWENVDELESWAYSKLRGLVKLEKTEISLHSLMLDFLEEVSTMGRLEKPYRLWTSLLRRYCFNLSKNVTYSRLNWLEDSHWFDSSAKRGVFSKSVQYTMEEQFTVLAGRYFRREELNSSPKQYIEAVDNWSKGSSDQKRVALFLIYHTVAAEGSENNLPTHPKLWNIFLSLKDDSDEKIQHWMHHKKILSWYERQLKVQKNKI